MQHGLNNNYLYSAVRLEATFQDDLNKIKIVTGMGFFGDYIGGICNLKNKSKL